MSVLGLVLVYCVGSVKSLWKNYNLKFEGAELPEPVCKIDDWTKHMKRDFAFYDLDWNNHSDIHKCSRILDNPVPMNTSNRAMLTCPPQLAIDTSCIPNAGLGVWAKSFIPRMTVFGPFEGQRVTNDDTDHSYGWNINALNWRANESILAQDPATSNWMRYVNSARNYAELNIKNFVDYSGNVYYIALEDIEPNTELMANYHASFNISPEMFWSGAFRHNLTYVSFDCKSCNKSYSSPLFAKQHLQDEHKDISEIQNNMNDWVLIRKPEKDFFSSLVEQMENFEGLNNTTNNIQSRNLTIAEELLQEYAKLSRQRRSKVDDKVEGKTKRKIKKSNQEKGTKNKLIITDATQHYTSISITPPYETTTEEMKRINLDFDSYTNLEEKIKQKLRDAGIAFEELNTTISTPDPTAPDPTDKDGQTNPIYNKEFFEYAARSSTGIESRELPDFLNKLKVLKTYGTLNVSKEREEQAIKNYKPPVSNASSASSEEVPQQSTTYTQVISSMKSLLNISSVIGTKSTKNGTFVTITESFSKKSYKRRTTEPCTCPTYSDYRLMWHNVSVSSTEREFNMHGPNNFIDVRPRYYNESSEPQYPDTKRPRTKPTTINNENQTSTAFNHVLKRTRKKMKTSKIPDIKNTRKKTKTTETIKTETKDYISTKKKTNRTKHTKERLKKNKTLIS
ncbi:uncharacterized protein LOC103511638 isoform X1 [Diaphorina citri]|uniref:Uncharacterized protein LOC103511638 isoform X1 n=1 Tax=Diaphorina citri TaxID=121845 RepID=A0A3Q0IY53_DIACI|nr:uncharacterized protein LOC103511638 isoform X1 [Diaphorina citri]KAI5712607.1 hypothetical protein M8J75_009808 [Diaphorina citri]